MIKYSTKNINTSNTEITNVASVNVDVHDETQRENILINKYTDLTAGLNQHNNFTVCVSLRISITTSPILLRISQFALFSL